MFELLCNHQWCTQDHFLRRIFKNFFKISPVPGRNRGSKGTLGTCERKVERGVKGRQTFNPYDEFQLLIRRRCDFRHTDFSVAQRVDSLPYQDSRTHGLSCAISNHFLRATAIHLVNREFPLSEVFRRKEKFNFDSS